MFPPANHPRAELPRASRRAKPASGVRRCALSGKKARDARPTRNDRPAPPARACSATASVSVHVLDDDGPRHCGRARFTEPALTSPIAKTPERRAVIGPVSTKPRSSRAISVAPPVRGSAPMNEERVRGHGLDALRAAHRQALETVHARRRRPACAGGQDACRGSPQEVLRHRCERDTPRQTSVTLRRVAAR